MGTVVVFLFIGLSVGVVVKTRPKFLNSIAPVQKFALYRKGEVDWKQNKEFYRDIPDGKKIFMLGWGFWEFDSHARWNYSNTPFLASILAVSSETSEIKVRFKNPLSMPYVGVEQDVKMIGCTRDNSFLTIENPKKAYSGLPFFDYAKVGDDLISFCLNKDCTQAGLMCKLYKISP